MKLTIDPEFRSLIPPLADEEYEQLEANLKSEGCRDPLVTWEGIIVDGHNRFDICTSNGIGFEHVRKQFADRSEAIEWIIRNQFGRRNLSDYSRGVLALRLKETIAARAKENIVEGGRAGGKGLTTLSKASDPINTRAAMAKAAGMSEGQMAKVEKIEANATPELKAKLASGKTSINKAAKEVAKSKPKKLRKPSIPNKEQIAKEHQRILGNLKAAWSVAPSSIRDEFIAWVEKTKQTPQA